MKKFLVTVCVTLLLTGCSNPFASPKANESAQVDTKPTVNVPIMIPPPAATKPPQSVETKPSQSVETKPSSPAEEKPSNKFEFRAEDLVIPETTILPPIPYTVPPPSSTEIPAPRNYTPQQNPMPRLNRDSNISLDDFRKKFQTAAADFNAPEINIDNFAVDYHEGENVFHGSLSDKVAMEIVFNKDTNMVKSVWFSGNITEKSNEELVTLAFVKTMKTFTPEMTEAQVDELLKTLSDTLQPYETNSVKILRSEADRNGIHYVISFTANGDFLWAAGAQ